MRVEGEVGGLNASCSCGLQTDGSFTPGVPGADYVVVLSFRKMRRQLWSREPHATTYGSRKTANLARNLITMSMQAHRNTSDLWFSWALLPVHRSCPK